MKTLRGLTFRHLTLFMAVLTIILNSFQTLLLEHINDSVTTLGKKYGWPPNLEKKLLMKLGWDVFTTGCDGENLGEQFAVQKGTLLLVR